MIKLSNVSKAYNAKPILKNISMNIRAGEVVGLIGPNGAGKTTIMKIMCGLIVNYSGDVERVNNFGFLIDTPKFLQNKNGQKNLSFFSQYYGDSSDYKKVYYDLGIDEFGEKKVSQYSLGMKQKLGVAISLMGNPQYLILDEPTNGMDPDNQKKVLDYIKKLAKEKNLGILISSHNLSGIENVCDKTYLLRNGGIVTQVEKNNEKVKIITIEQKDLPKVKKLFMERDILIEADTITVSVEKYKKVIDTLNNYSIIPISISNKEGSLEKIYFETGLKGDENNEL